MAEQLKNTLSFTNLAPGATIVLPHGLNDIQKPLAPDIVFVPDPSLDVAASDDVAITLLNKGDAPISGAVLVEAWHTIERAFGGAQNEDLPVKPYIVLAEGGSSQTPWPPFQPSVRTIYARPTGDDSSGDGTSANPYRTFQRAMQDVPARITPGARVVVDITGIVETLPPNYALPPIETPFGLDFNYTFGPSGIYPFNTVTAFEIIATPRPASALAPSDQTVMPGDLIGPGITFDADTQLVEIHTSKNYAADQLKGYMAQDQFGLRGVVWHNTAGPNSIVYLTIAQVPDEIITPVYSSSQFPVSAPLSFVEQSATLITTKNPTDTLRGGLLVCGVGGVGIRGIDIHLAAPFFSPTGFDVECFGSRTVFFEGCKLDGLGAFHEGGPIGVLNCVVHDAIFVSELPVNCFGTLLVNVPSFGAPWSTPTNFVGIGFVLDGCGAFGTRLNAVTPVGRGPMSEMQLRYGVIKGGAIDLDFAQIADPANFPAPFVPNSLNPALATPGHGIILRGGKAMIDHVKIFGCAGDGIHIEAGYGFAEIKSVTGGRGGTIFGDLTDTANGGVGVYVTDGAFVRCSDQDPVPNPVVTNVHGSTGLGDLQVGDAPGGLSSSWLAFHINKQLFDITAVGPGGATGSGSRAFEKP